MVSAPSTLDGLIAETLAVCDNYLRLLNERASRPNAAADDLARLLAGRNSQPNAQAAVLPDGMADPAPPHS